MQTRDGAKPSENKKKRSRITNIPSLFITGVQSPLLTSFFESCRIESIADLISLNLGLYYDKIPKWEKRLG